MDSSHSLTAPNVAVIVPPLVQFTWLKEESVEEFKPILTQSLMHWQIILTIYLQANFFACVPYHKALIHLLGIYPLLIIVCYFKLILSKKSKWNKIPIKICKIFVNFQCEKSEVLRFVFTRIRVRSFWMRTQTYVYSCPCPNNSGFCESLD